MIVPARGRLSDSFKTGGLGVARMPRMTIKREGMRVGIGLPAAIPGASATLVGEWAAAGERAGFSSLGVIDRLVYENLEPLLTLAAAAERTDAIELLSTVLTVGYRGNPVVLAKQIATLDELSGGRLALGIGLGGWPDDYLACNVGQTGLGALFEEILRTMRDAWAGRITGASGAMRDVAPGWPRLLIAGLVPAAYARAAAWGKVGSLPPSAWRLSPPGSPGSDALGRRPGARTDRGSSSSAISASATEPRRSRATTSITTTGGPTCRRSSPTR